MLHAIIFFTHTDILPDSCNRILVSGKIKAKDLLNDGVSGSKLLDRAQICECVCVLSFLVPYIRAKLLNYWKFNVSMTTLVRWLVGFCHIYIYIIYPINSILRPPKYRGG